MVAVGIPLLAIDGNPTCDSPNPTKTCPSVYNTRGGGAALLSVGLLSLVGSAVLFYFDYHAQHPKPEPVGFHVKSWVPNLWAGASGAQVGYEGSF